MRSIAHAIQQQNLAVNHNIIRKKDLGRIVRPLGRLNERDRDIRRFVVVISDVVDVLLLESVDELSHLLDTAMTDLLEILTQAALYLVLQTRLFTEGHSNQT